MSAAGFPAAAARLRSGWVLPVVALHFGVYLLVNVVNGRRPSTAFHDLSTAVDSWIPYLGASWLVYYAAVPYVVVLGALAIARLPEASARRAVKVFVAMIVGGGLVQLALPARSPWPADGSVIQRFFHESVSYDPFVCLPSMHVALVTLTALLAGAVFRSAAARAGHGAAVVLVSLSTLTFKEHYVLDVVAGGLLAGTAFAAWRRGGVS